jgi:hypothetical protein
MFRCSTAVAVLTAAALAGCAGPQNAQLDEAERTWERGAAASQSGNHASAHAFYIAASGQYAQGGDALNAATMLNNAGAVLGATGDYAGAVNHQLRIAARVFEASGLRCQAWDNGVCARLDGRGDDPSVGQYYLVLASALAHAESGAFGELNWRGGYAACVHAAAAGLDNTGAGAGEFRGRLSRKLEGCSFALRIEHPENDRLLRYLDRVQVAAGNEVPGDLPPFGLPWQREVAGAP